MTIKRSCDVENMGDFGRYYANGWVGWHPTDAAHITPAYVVGVAGNDVLAVRFLSKTPEGFQIGNNSFVNWQDVLAHVDFGLPEIGLLPEGPTIAFHSYSTPRQAHKGYRPRATTVSEFNSWAIRKKVVPSADRNHYDRVWFVFNPEHASMESAWTSLEKGERVGISVCRNVGLYTTSKFKFPLVAYKRWTIGHAPSPDLISIKQQYELYQNEIAQSTGVKVVVA